MGDCIKPTIEKIKLQEQDNEARLKEKREINATILSLNRAIHEASINIEKLTKEHQSLIASTDLSQQQLVIEKIRQSALTDQVSACRKELDEMQNISIKGVSSVWEKRVKLFETIQSVSDKCDIRALLMKPACEIKTNVSHVQTSEPVIHDDSKLKAAIERKNKAIATRNFLLNEPDIGEEFVRTRNALQYSLEIMATEQNN